MSIQWWYQSHRDAIANLKNLLRVTICNRECAIKSFILSAKCHAVIFIERFPVNDYSRVLVAPCLMVRDRLPPLASIMKAVYCSLGA